MVLARLASHRDQGLVRHDLATAHSRVVYDGRSYGHWQITLNFRRFVRPVLVHNERFPDGCNQDRTPHIPRRLMQE